MPLPHSEYPVEGTEAMTEVKGSPVPNLEEIYAERSKRMLEIINALGREITPEQAGHLSETVKLLDSFKPGALEKVGVTEHDLLNIRGVLRALSQHERLRHESEHESE